VRASSHLTTTTMNFAQQEQLLMIDRLTESVVAGKKTISTIASTVSPKYAQLVQERLDARGYSADSSDGLSPQQFHAKIQKMQREYFLNRSAQGIQTQRVSQQDHNFIVDSIFNSVHAGTKPAVRPMLEAYGKEHSRATAWAKRAAVQKHSKKLGKTIAIKKDHPVLQDLKEGRMLSPTHKSTLQNATYSGFAELLFSGSQSVRSQRELQKRMDTLEAELAVVRADAARANTRLDESEQWKADAVELYGAGKSYADIADIVGKGKSTVNDYIRSLISAGKVPKRPARNCPVLDDRPAPDDSRTNSLP
jgi:hypothetical protein